VTNRPPGGQDSAEDNSRKHHYYEGTPVATERKRPVISDGLPSQLPDIDPEETAEWVESLDGVIDERGAKRARYIMLRLLERARERQVGVPPLTTTDYINTIPSDVCGTLVLFMGCGNDASTTRPAAQTAPMSTNPAAGQAAPTVAAEEKEDAMNAAATAATREQNRIQELIETARTLTGQNKFVEALKALGELSGLELSPEQRGVVDALKKTAEQQAAKAVSDEAVARTSITPGSPLGGGQ
jgi:hypothetical protein